MFKLLRSKKGIGIDDVLPLLVVIILAALALILLPFLKSSQTSSQAVPISGAMRQIDGTDNLINLLRTPVGDEKIYDLVVQAHMTKEYDKLTGELKNYLDPLYTTQDTSWTLSIEGKKIQGALCGRCADSDEIGKIILPLPDTNQITLQLFYLHPSWLTGGS